MKVGVPPTFFRLVEQTRTIDYIVLKISLVEKLNGLSPVQYR